jgi:Domain of unknown function (DUF4190)
MSDSYGQGGNGEDDQTSGGSDYPKPPPSGGSGYPPPPPGGSGYPPPPPPGESGYPPPPGQGGYPAGQPSGYPPPGQAPGYPPPPGEQQPYPYGGYGSGYPGGAWDSERPRGWSGLAIASFIVALVAPCIGVLVAIPLGIVALVKIRRSGDKGKVFAILGIIIPVLWLAAIGGVVAWFASSTAERNEAGVIVESGRLQFEDVRTGDCLDIDNLDEDAEIGIFDIEGVPCSDGHNAEVASIVDLQGGAVFPGESDVRQQASVGCARVQAELPPGMIVYPVYPTEELWDDENNRRAVCFAVQSDFSDMTGKQLN